MKILIVEDDFLSRKLLNTYLLPYGEIDHAANGREAVEAVTTALEEDWNYDLVCMDIMMPGMDGLDALKKIRQLEKDKGISEQHSSYIFMVTAFSEKEHVVKAALSSCDAYLIKPITKQRLLERMKVLGLIETADE